MTVKKFTDFPNNSTQLNSNNIMTTQIKFNDASEICSFLEENDFDFQIAESYGEPGYSSDKPIILGDWNNLDDDTCDAIEEHFEIEWEDEWIVLYDEDCKAYRTSPDCYGWQPSTVFWKGEIVSWDWIKENGELADYVQDELAGNHKTALNCSLVGIDDLSRIAEEVSQERYQNGLHEHMTDDPKAILESFPEEERHYYFFRIDSTSQFHIEFELWKLLPSDDGDDE